MAYRSAYPWYDSLWLDAYRKARGILAEVRPDLRGDFEEALAVLRVPADFRVREVPDLLDPESLAALTEVVLGLHLRDLAAGEAVAFGRLITHDHPVTRDIQQQLLGLAGELAGEELVPSYTFVSLPPPLLVRRGRRAPHSQRLSRRQWPSSRRARSASSLSRSQRPRPANSGALGGRPPGDARGSGRNSSTPSPSRGNATRGCRARP